MTLCKDCGNLVRPTKVKNREQCDHCERQERREARR